LEFVFDQAVKVVFAIVDGERIGLLVLSWPAKVCPMESTLYLHLSQNL